MITWLTLDSIPTDGTPVLTYMPNSPMPYRIVAYVLRQEYRNGKLRITEDSWRGLSLKLSHEEFMLKAIAWSPLEPPPGFQTEDIDEAAEK